jgi:hypothetical protein
MRKKYGSHMCLLSIRTSHDNTFKAITHLLPVVVVLAYNLSTGKVKAQELRVQGQLELHSKTLSQKSKNQTKKKTWAGGAVKVEEHLPSKHETPVPPKKK